MKPIIDNFYNSFFLLMAVIILLAQFHSAPAHYRLVVFQEDGETDTVQYYTSFKTAQREIVDFNITAIYPSDNTALFKFDLFALIIGFQIGTVCAVTAVGIALSSVIIIFK